MTSHLISFFRLKLRNDHPNALHFDSFLIFLGDHKIKKTKEIVKSPQHPLNVLFPLYPFNTIQLHAVFVYGTDFSRQMNILSIPKLVKMLARKSYSWVWQQSFSVLCVGNSHSNASIQCQQLLILSSLSLVADDFKWHTNWKKWIFGILSLGAFFIISLFAGDMLFYMYRILNQKVNTFQELSTIETPIHSNPTLTMYGDDIQKMLRFVWIHFHLNKNMNLRSHTFRRKIGKMFSNSLFWILVEISMS